MLIMVLSSFIQNVCHRMDTTYSVVEIHIRINFSCTHLLGSSGAYASCPKKILKMWCSLVRFGVYFDQIVS